MTDIITYNISYSYVDPTTEIGDNVFIGPLCIIGGEAFWPEREGTVLKNREFGGSVILEEGVMILGSTTIERSGFKGGYTRIGRGTIIDHHCLIGHDCVIGEGCKIIAGSIIGGAVEVGKCAYIGLNSTIRNKIRIGPYSQIGCGSNVVKDVPPFEVWAGNPAKKLRDDTYWNLKEEEKSMVLKEWYKEGGYIKNWSW